MASARVAALDSREASALAGILRELDVPPYLAVWLEPAIRLTLIVIVWYGLHRLVRLLVRRLEQRLLDTADLKTESQFDVRKRVGTLVSLLKQVVNIFLFVILALVLLMQLGVQVGPLIAGAGIIGVAVGFGAGTVSSRSLVSGGRKFTVTGARTGAVPAAASSSQISAGPPAVASMMNDSRCSPSVGAIRIVVGGDGAINRRPGGSASPRSGGPSSGP